MLKTWLPATGGEEFLILLPYTNCEQSKVKAEILRGQTETERIGPDRIRVTSSFGISAIGGHESIESLIGRADRALYKAKREGKNRVVIDI